MYTEHLRRASGPGTLQRRGMEGSRDDKFPKGVRRDERCARLRPLGIRRLASGSRIQKRSRCPNSLCLSVGAAVSRLPSMRLIFSAASVTMSPPVTSMFMATYPHALSELICLLLSTMVLRRLSSSGAMSWEVGIHVADNLRPVTTTQNSPCHHYQPWHCRTAVGRPSYAYGIIDLVRRRSRLISLHLWAAGL